MEEWLPSPGQMSVDSMSPQPPPAAPTPSSGGVNQLNGLSTPSVISSSGYSPSPMSTGSYEPPFSPGGASKLGESMFPFNPQSFQLFDLATSRQKGQQLFGSLKFEAQL